MPDVSFTELPGRRVVLRRFRPEDVAEFVAYRSDAEVARCQSWDAPYPPEEGERFVAQMMTAHPDTPGEWFQFAVALRAAGQLIGDCAAIVHADDPSQCEIGFTIAPRCGDLCAATGRIADALTLWASCVAVDRHRGLTYPPWFVPRWQEKLRQARQALGPGRARAAEDRGAAMSLATAAEYALLLTDPSPPQPAAPGRGQLSVRERELVTLVAQGRTNAQIANQLHISVRPVSSHLDRIRDKTGYRRRADLTRLALSEGLV